MKLSTLKKSPALIGVLFICGLLLSPVPALAGKDTPFTADQVTISPDGAREMKGLIYYDTDKMRMEMTLPGGPGKMIVIYLKNEKKMAMVSPKRKVYFEMSLDESQWPGITDIEKTEKKKLGTEKVSGYKCTKYLIIRKMNIMGKPTEVKVTTWISDRFSVPLRSKTEMGGTQELRNIKEGKPSADLFKVPSGYKKAANMMEIMAPQ